MEMDYQPNRFFDDTGQWLLCATHGAPTRPDTGACVRRPLPRRAGEDHPDRSRTAVHWHTAYNLQPVEF
jgi:nitrite reductase/ring-hydroxylating ferredoxin subunit